ncbi:MAG: pilus assembly protein TadG-related protein [Rhizobiaceae bacterium]
MFRRFLRDRRGNYMLLTAASMVPIMGGLAVAIDYTEMARQRQETLNALDAAGIAAARYVVAGASDAAVKAYAKDFFEANLASVKPSNTTLTVLLPKDNIGGGTLKMSADLKYQPYFFPTFAKLIGKESGDGDTKMDFSATSEIKLKNTLEVALVLDNSGSMDYTGSGSGKKRITLLKDAAKQLVDTIAAEAAQMKQVSKPVQFGLVPFAASVNIGSGNASAAWMDQDGISPVHHENFDWTTMSSGSRRAEKIGGIWYKKGTAWGGQENQKLTRFSMYQDVKYRSSRTWVANNVCVRWWSNGSCRTWEDQGQYQYTESPYANWQGCVEARPYPYNVNDATPSTSTPATLYVPMYGPDETDNKDNSNRRAENNWWEDVTSSSNNKTRQRYMPKYYQVGDYGMDAASASTGPNASCTTNAITPLTDVSATAGKDAIKAAIDAMSPNGATNAPEGMAWGWRVVSSGAPFTQGRSETERGNDKVVIVLTDGANTYYTPSSLGYNDLGDNGSTYSAYGFTKQGYNGTSTTRLFMNTSNSVGKSDYSNENYTKALNEQFTALCNNAKAEGIIVMTVALDLSTSNNTEKGQIDALKACSSDSRFRKAANGSPEKLFWNSTGGNLADTFKAIADELSNLRIVS